MVALLAQQLHVMAGARLLRRRGSRCSAAAAAEQLAQQPVPPPGCTLHTLPHGLSISHTASPAEVAFLYREQWVQQVYLQHGVCIRPGDVVLDVGANAGLFACFAAEAAGPSGRVLCLEPAPITAAALAANMQQHAAWCAAQQGREVATSEVIEAAVGDGSTTHAQLAVYSNASGWSTLAGTRQDQELLDNMQVYLANVVQAGPRADDDGWSPVQRALVACASWLHRSSWLRPLSSALARLYVRHVLMGEVQTVDCRVVTISQLIEQYGLGRIDLAKIDVERAELQVLEGISQQHWPLVKQVAMEVHDLDGRLQQVAALLRRHGFDSVVWEQDAELAGSTLYNLWATRRSRSEGNKQA